MNKDQGSDEKEDPEVDTFEEFRRKFYDESVDFLEEFRKNQHRKFEKLEKRLEKPCLRAKNHRGKDPRRVSFTEVKNSYPPVSYTPISLPASYIPLSSSTLSSSTS